MRKLSIALVLILGLVATSCSREEMVVPTTELSMPDLALANETDWALANQILGYINNFRTDIGLEPLIMEPTITTALAVSHSEYMKEQDRISHDNFSERATILADQGAQAVGENVAFGYSSAHEVVNAWINSPSHRDVLEGNFTHAGIGTVNDKFNNTHKFITFLVTRK